MTGQGPNVQIPHSRQGDFMHYFFGFLVLFATQSWAGETLQDSLHLLEVTNPDTQTVTVKFRDGVVGINGVLSACAGCFQKPAAVAPLFRRGAETYRKERVGAMAVGPHLENNQGMKFNTQLNEAQAAQILRALYND